MAKPGWRFRAANFLAAVIGGPQWKLFVLDITTMYLYCVDLWGIKEVDRLIQMKKDQVKTNIDEDLIWQRK